MKKLLAYTAAGLGVVLLILLVWGLVEPRLVDVERRDATIPDLPAAWEGQRIAQVSDFQVGMWLDNPGTAEEAVETIAAEDPAAVLITGDFVYHPDDDDKVVEDLRTVAQIVRPLKDANIPTYAVLGNHDYAMPQPDATPNEELAARIVDALESEGVRVLFDEAVPLHAEADGSDRADGSPLYLVGIGSHFAAADEDAERAVDDVPDGAARVVMMHHPDSFKELPSDTAPLAVAGHTHGGQMRLPGLPSFSYQSFAKTGEVHVDGWVDDYGASGNTLYVNRGIGMSLVPLRINCKPEVTLFRLRSE